jgi:hypothetical protein
MSSSATHNPDVRSGDLESLRLDACSLAERVTALVDACVGWTRSQRCTDELGNRLADPHPRCLRAAYWERRLLLEGDSSAAPPVTP